MVSRLQVGAGVELLALGHPRGLGQEGQGCGRRPVDGGRRMGAGHGGAGSEEQGQEDDGQTRPHGRPTARATQGPPSAAAGAWAATFPIHFGRQPTPGALPSAACSLSDCNLWWRPPPSFPIGSVRRVTPFIWWGVRSGTPSSPRGDEAVAERGSDLYFTTDARPDAIEAVVSGWADAAGAQGKRFGTIGCLHDGQKYEITTHRAEAYRPDSRKPDVAFGTKVEDDLARRDFTINAMALRLPELELIDPFDGLDDIAARRLRTPLDPEVSFADDPLRICGPPGSSLSSIWNRPPSWWPPSACRASAAVDRLG